MSSHRYIDAVCVAAVVLAAALTLLFLNGEALGLRRASRAMGYEDTLFDTAQVHTIDISLGDWEGFLETCEDEQYTSCTVTIDGETLQTVGIRAKGNTSLTMVSSLDSDRYSFKLEFDHYDSGGSYHGLDKLCLNNCIQDNTYLKDYLSYQLMGSFGVDAPLCSFAYLTVNGEDWGLYLAVEGVEDAFLQRSYGRDHGALYKPDSVSLGAGPGQGKNFQMEDFDPQAWEDGQGMPGQPPEGTPEERPEGMADELPEGMPEGGTPSEGFPGGMPEGMPDGMSGGPGGFGASADVKLQYIDDAAESYPNLFDSAKTDVTPADQSRLIEALRRLSAQEDLEDTLDLDKVLRYFVVHNFLVNDDSYTGSMVHNYYLYEAEGKLAMIPWDYNLAFGTFQSQDATAQVNDPIDEILSDRPMQSWIFSDQEYTQRYHQLYQTFLDQTDLDTMIQETAALIAPYVARDPTKFCTEAEFEQGVETLRQFCRLRRESIQGQLAGTIPSDTAGQEAAPEARIDASALELADMGTMDMGGKGGPPERGSGPQGERPGPGQRPEF